MVDYSSASLPPPKDWQEFERCCRVLFESILCDPQTALNGRGGQPQHGVDVYGRRDGNTGLWVGVQCKGKEVKTYGEGVTDKELRAEVNKAFNFIPRLSEFVLVTTAPNDANIQSVARLITEENKKTGNLMTVAVWGWGELQTRISQYPAAIRAFHPDSTPFTDEILSGQDRIETKVETGTAAIFSELKKMSTVLYTQLGNTSGSSANEQNDLESHLHKEIDMYRDFIMNGKSKTGMELLEKLKEKIWGKASNRIKFRITTNIGAALLHLGDEESAANLFLSAIVYDPFDKVGMANVALAYLIKSDDAQTIRAATAALHKDPENENAACYLIQAHFKDTSITDPFSLIPENLRQKRGTLIGAISFWRRRGMADWRKLAHEAVALFPETDELRRAAAESYLDAICESRWCLLGQGSASDNYLKNLNDAISVLQSIWETIKTREDKIDVGLATNLASAYRILDKNENAAKVLDEALAKVPDDIILIKLRAISHIALKQEDEALALLLKKRGTDPEAAILTAELLLSKDLKKVQDLLAEISKLEMNDEQGVLVSLLQIDAYLRDSKYDIALERARSLAADYPEKIEVIIALSNTLEKCGDSSAEETLLKARDLINENSPFVDRFLIAKELNHWEYYDEAVEILDGRVDFQRDTPALQLFLTALKQSNRRRKAYECIKSLPPALAENPWYLKMEAGVHIDRGDYPSAEKALDKYLKLRPEDISMRHIWIGLCYRRSEGTAKIRAFLEGNVESMKGDVIDRMQLAILLDKFGFEERALQFGYRIFLENPENPEIHCKYMALLLQPNKSGAIDLNVNEIGPDAVFVIENDRGEIENFLIENDEHLRVNTYAYAIPQDHPFALKAMRQRVGYTFTIDKTIGPSENWRIKSIKHKYLDSLHKCMERFNRQFPSFQGFQRVAFDPKSPEAIFPAIKARHDAFEDSFAQLDKSPVPLLVFAEILGTNVITAFQSIVGSGKKFRVCVGTIEERDIAAAAVVNNSCGGCVVDALTFYFIRRLGIEDAIVGMCGRIGMTEYSVDVFRQRLEEIELHGGKPFLVMFFKNGQFFKEEITTKQLSASLNEVKKDLLYIETNCDILPVESDLRVPPIFNNIAKRIGKNLFDSILAADSSNRILLCEDYIYRLLATTDSKLPATWLQPVLMMARDKKILSPEKYDDAAYYMLDRGLEYISVDVNNLLHAANLETDLDGKIFKRIAEALGGHSADMRSHINVTASFLREIWKEYDPPLKRKAQTSKVLECLLNGRRNEYQLIVRVLNIQVNSQNHAFRHYLIDWLKGHFYLPFHTE